VNVVDARAEALFASFRDPSEAMTAAEVEAAVREAVKRLRLSGCVCRVAQEFGDHPDTALARMAWARKTVAATWPKRGQR
jgi:hypothetical protein